VSTSEIKKSEYFYHEGQFWITVVTAAFCMQSNDCKNVGLQQQQQQQQQQPKKLENNLARAVLAFSIQN
jgi:hypothetical protein